jgi:hypothetical protein
MNFEEVAKGESGGLNSSGTAISVLDFVSPVLDRLKTFNPEANYQREDVRDALRRLIKLEKVKGITLLPNLLGINPTPLNSKEGKLLIAHCCQVYVDLIIYPRLGRRPRLKPTQKEFVFNLANEIHELENDGEYFS